MADHRHHQDDEIYTSKIGLSCAQHEHLDCHGFVDVGFSVEEVKELVSRCPQSCSSSPIMSKRVHVNAYDTDKQRRSLQYIAYQNKWSANRGGNDVVGEACQNPGWKNDLCRDNPAFIADALLLPCESFQLLECTKLNAIGLDEAQVHRIINACPCSCDIPCGTWTMSPTSAPTFSPTISHQPTTAAPSTRPTPQPSQSPTRQPSRSPTVSPSNFPTRSPTLNPTNYPTLSPTQRPTQQPSMSPTFRPTNTPTTSAPSKKPTNTPTMRPTLPPSRSPTPFPTTASPTSSMPPSSSPSSSPSLAPSVSFMPTSSSYWAAASVWQEHKETFQGLFVIFGAVAVALLAFGIVALYRKLTKTASRDTVERDGMLKVMGYASNAGRGESSQRNGRGKKESKSKIDKESRGKDKRKDRRDGTKTRVKFVEPNVRSNNARVPAEIYEQPIYDQAAEHVMDHPMDGILDEKDPAIGWLDNYALRHQPPPTATIRVKITPPSDTDDFATLGTARSSSSTLNTKKTKETAISMLSKSSKRSQGSGKGSIVVFERPPAPLDVPNTSETKEKKKRNESLLKALPLVGRDQTSMKAASTADLAGIGDIVISGPLEKGKGAEDTVKAGAMQYVLPGSSKQEESKQRGKKDGRLVFRWPIARKTNDPVEKSCDKSPVGLVEQPQQAKDDYRCREGPTPSAQPEECRHSASREKMKEDFTYYSSDSLYQQKVEVETRDVGKEAAAEPSEVQEDKAISGVQLPTWSERGAWLPTGMFQAPRAQNKPEEDPVVASPPPFLPPQLACIREDVQWAASATEPIFDLEQGTEQPAAKSSRLAENLGPGYLPSMPQVEWPAWIAGTAAPSELSAARQQASIMSPTTEDGIGAIATSAGTEAFNFDKVDKMKAKSKAKKWLKGKSKSRSVADDDAPDGGK